MRYREDGTVNPDYPYSESMHHMLSFSMVLGVAVGLVLLWLGMHGKIMWLKVWSIGLIACSAGYLAADMTGVL